MVTNIPMVKENHDDDDNNTTDINNHKSITTTTTDRRMVGIYTIYGQDQTVSAILEKIKRNKDNNDWHVLLR
jgi:hypothetical protein